jgi:hypothetical protein
VRVGHLWIRACEVGDQGSVREVELVDQGISGWTWTWTWTFCKLCFKKLITVMDFATKFEKFCCCKYFLIPVWPI